MRPSIWDILAACATLVAFVLFAETRDAQTSAPGNAPAAAISSAAVTLQPRAEARSPFRALDVYVDTGAAQLAAYQFELTTTANAAGGDLKLVGIEGGEPAAFREPPRYDPRALASATPRVIIAAFDTGKDLPAGRTRVARLMVRVASDGKPAEYEAHLTAAATPDGTPIAGAKLQIVEGASR